MKRNLSRSKVNSLTHSRHASMLSKMLVAFLFLSQIIGSAQAFPGGFGGFGGGGGNNTPLPHQRVFPYLQPALPGVLPLPSQGET